MVDSTLTRAVTPPRVRSRGRPKEVRMKSPIDLHPRPQSIKVHGLLGREAVLGCVNEIR